MVYWQLSNGFCSCAMNKTSNFTINYWSFRNIEIGIYAQGYDATGKSAGHNLHGERRIK